MQYNSQVNLRNKGGSFLGGREHRFDLVYLRDKGGSFLGGREHRSARLTYVIRAGVFLVDVSIGSSTSSL